MFQLKAQLERARVSHPNDAMPSESEFTVNEILDQEIEMSEEQVAAVSCDGKPASGNKKIRARLGRRRTHNEQLILRPCGIIVSRATFFGAESVSGVVVRAVSSFKAGYHTI
jgi:hypothetical protein